MKCNQTQHVPLIGAGHNTQGEGSFMYLCNFVFIKYKIF